MARETKQRATVICRRDDEVLLVRRAGARWNLPGGRIKRGEVPSEAALRELAEETGIEVERLRAFPAMELGQTRHHVFAARVAAGQGAEPANEIAECRWFSAKALAKRKWRKVIRELLGPASLLCPQEGVVTPCSD